MRKDTFYWVLGKGTEIAFWTDAWCSDHHLSVLFPRIFSIYLFQDGCVSDFFINNEWSIPLKRRLFEWEKMDFEAFLKMLEGFVVSLALDDKLIWKGCNKGVVTSKMLYESSFTVDNLELKSWWNAL
ncbi:hypothetical protein REPUB_Repub15cG0008000 [Reevesia pubescens]